MYAAGVSTGLITFCGSAAASFRARIALAPLACLLAIAYPLATARMTHSYSLSDRETDTVVGCCVALA